MGKVINKPTPVAGSTANRFGKKPVAAYHNIRVSKGGKMVKLAGIPLYADNPLHAGLIANADNLDRMIFEMDINIVEENNGDFDFATDDTTEQLKKVVK